MTLPFTNIFVLCTGRCGSTTFTRASAHMSNYTAGHETRTHLTGAARFAYPLRHIEADNRLSWLLGRLDRSYGQNALYVHLRRDPEEVARSFERRADKGIMLAYRTDILQRAASRNRQTPMIEFCRDYVETVTTNLQDFLADKPHQMNVWLETGKADFAYFWDQIGAEGDMEAALAEWDSRHNASKAPAPAG
ncbi:MAG: hypothetical protein ACK4YU_02700 [Paracoccus sp. (in: a-proteobacteria)]